MTVRILDAKPFREFSKANLERGVIWHNGSLANWTPLEWGGALAGETGELCNVLKKIARDSAGITGNKEGDVDLLAKAGEEIADVFIYLDLVAQRLGLDLFNCVVQKFNATSDRVGIDVHIAHEFKRTL